MRRVLIMSRELNLDPDGLPDIHVTNDENDMSDCTD